MDLLEKIVFFLYQIPLFHNNNKKKNVFTLNLVKSCVIMNIIIAALSFALSYSRLCNMRCLSAKCIWLIKMWCFYYFFGFFFYGKSLTSNPNWHPFLFNQIIRLFYIGKNPTKHHKSLMESEKYCHLMKWDVMSYFLVIYRSCCCFCCCRILIKFNNFDQ